MPWKTVDPTPIVFRDDGAFPNSSLPILYYRGCLDGTAGGLADAFESRLATHGWTNAWRNGVYPFPHYHSTAHEVLAVYRGSATIHLGGPTLGKHYGVRAGDVLVIPAGVSHQNLGASADFAVLGAYPDGQHWDLLRGDRADRPQADKNIARVPLPGQDPLYGANGPLTRLWAR